MPGVTIEMKTRDFTMKNYTFLTILCIASLASCQKLEDLSKCDNVFEMVDPKYRQMCKDKKERERQEIIKTDAMICKARREHEYKKECEEEKRMKMSKEARLRYDLEKIEEAEKSAIENKSGN